MNSITAENVEKVRIPNLPTYGHPEMEPGRDAWELLQRVWMTKGPRIVTLPVDSAIIATKLGAMVFDDELPPEVAGILRKPAGSADPKIYTNPLDSRHRQCFTCAQALGHLSRSVESGEDDALEVVEPRGLIVDSYATEFALELLMPRVAMREVIDTRSVIALAGFFGVPVDVMSLRLDRIGGGRPCLR
jgi:Zn-dependent peptidase ImmA (M78 family)